MPPQQRPRQQRQRQQCQIEPPGLRVVEARLQEAAEVLADHEVVEESGHTQLHQPRPRHCDCGPQRQREQRMKFKRCTPSSPRYEIRDQDQSRQDDPMQSLGQGRGAGARRGGANPPRAPRLDRVQRLPQTGQRRANPERNLQVHVRVLARQQPQWTGRQHSRAPQRRATIEHCSSERVNEQTSGEAEQRRHQSHGGFVHAKQRQ